MPDPQCLTVENLSIAFPSPSGPVKVVDDVSFSVAAGHSLVIAGESGSGKSMVCQSLLGIVPDSAVVSGTRIGWRKQDLLRLTEHEWRSRRGADIAMIFQDPTAALNPLITVEHQIRDVIRAHRRCSRVDARARTVEVLGMAGFPEPALRMRSYPSELSGGLRQRVAIAMALAAGPSLIIADEATTNLDVSIQAQIIRLLASLRDELGLALIFVTHDLGLAADIGGDMLVMYAGQGVEYGPVDSVLSDPCHPYTIGLLGSAPTMTSSRAHPLKPIPGQPPRPGTIGNAAPFLSRCPVAVDGVCDRLRPQWTGAGTGHQVACHRFARDGRSYRMASNNAGTALDDVGLTAGTEALALDDAGHLRRDDIADE